MGLRHFFAYHTIFSLIIVLHLGRHLRYIKMLNDARVASLGFFKDNVCTTRINKEKKFKIKFHVLLKFTQILPDYFPYLNVSFALTKSACPYELSPYAAFYLEPNCLPKYPLWGLWSS